jgi:hypothetical protein
MSKYLDVPPELLPLIEKRSGDDRRKPDQRSQKSKSVKKSTDSSPISSKAERRRKVRRKPKR